MRGRETACRKAQLRSNPLPACEAPICSGRQDGLTGVTQGRNVMVQRVPHRGEINGTVRVDIEIAGVLDNAPDCLRSDGSTQ